MWVIDNGCSRHMERMKESFNFVKKIDGGSVRLRDNAKEEVVGVEFVNISPSGVLIEVYLVDGLTYNILSISQSCDVGFYILWNAPSAISQEILPSVMIGSKKSMF